MLFLSSVIYTISESCTLNNALTVVFNKVLSLSHSICGLLQLKYCLSHCELTVITELWKYVAKILERKCFHAIKEMSK